MSPRSPPPQKKPSRYNAGCPGGKKEGDFREDCWGGLRGSSLREDAGTVLRRDWTTLNVERLRKYSLWNSSRVIVIVVTSRTCECHIKDGVSNS